MRLRPAHKADQPLLEHWDSAPHVQENAGDDGPWDWANELGRDVPWQRMYVAELAGRPIGFVQIIDPAEEESHYWGDAPANLRAIDIWIGEADCLNQGHGSAMMRQALALCFDVDGADAVLIDPLAGNSRAIRFYERCGFSPVGPRTFGSDECLVMRIDRADWLSRAAAVGQAAGPAASVST